MSEPFWDWLSDDRDVPRPLFVRAHLRPSPSKAKKCAWLVTRDEKRELEFEAIAVSVAQRQPTVGQA